MFVFVIMVVAASQPVLQTVKTLVGWVARIVPADTTLAQIWLCLALVPLVGSLASGSVYSSS